MPAKHCCPKQRFAKRIARDSKQTQEEAVKDGYIARDEIEILYFKTIEKNVLQFYCFFFGSFTTPLQGRSLNLSSGNLGIVCLQQSCISSKLLNMFSSCQVTKI